MDTLIATFNTKDNKKVEIHCIQGKYLIFSNEELKQKQMTPNDCIRYLAHRLQGK